MDGSRVTKDRAKALRRAMSLPEILLWKAIKGGAVDCLHFRKQHPVGPYILDFYRDTATPPPQSGFALGEDLNLDVGLLMFYLCSQP